MTFHPSFSQIFLKSLPYDLSFSINFSWLVPPWLALLYPKIQFFSTRNRPFPMSWNCCFSVAKSCLTLSNPVDCSAPASYVLRCLPVCSDSCLLSWWCSLTISSSAAPSPFASNLVQHQGLFQWVDSSGGQSIRASESVFPMNFQGWFLLGLTGLISLLSKGVAMTCWSKWDEWKWLCNTLSHPLQWGVAGEAHGDIQVPWNQSTLEFWGWRTAKIQFLPRSVDFGWTLRLGVFCNQNMEAWPDLSWPISISTSLCLSFWLQHVGS